MPERVRVVDGLQLGEEMRAVLRPDEVLADGDSVGRRLPRYFYEVPSHEAAKEMRLTPHFGVNEFLLVDVKETLPLRAYPRYVPCAVTILAFYLECFRQAAGGPVSIAYNGGYRSPAHRLSLGLSAHMWGTAADVYRVGSTVLNDSDAIQKYGRLAREIAPSALQVKPYGHDLGSTDDHLHVELGYLTLEPRERD